MVTGEFHVRCTYESKPGHGNSASSSNGFTRYCTFRCRCCHWSPFLGRRYCRLSPGKLWLERATFSVRPDMALLFISAPLGAYGLVALWSTLLRIFRSRPHQSPRSTIVGLLCGIIASAHLVFIKFGLPVLLLPATLFALYHVSKSTKAVRGTNGT